MDRPNLRQRCLKRNLNSLRTAPQRGMVWFCSGFVDCGLRCGLQIVWFRLLWRAVPTRPHRKKNLRSRTLHNTEATEAKNASQSFCLAQKKMDPESPLIWDTYSSVINAGISELSIELSNVELVAL